MTKKILWVKFGWSDYYRGGSVDGNFGWLNDNRGQENEGRGHEAFNFMPHQEIYYCYTPLQAGRYAPYRPDNAGWTVVCLAKNPKHTGIHIVGWYENATLFDSLQAPNPAAAAAGEEDWFYSITSQEAFFVRPEDRNTPFSHPSVKQSKYSFLTDSDVENDEKKAEVREILERQLKRLRKKVVPNPDVTNTPDPETNPSDPLIGFGTPEHCKKVEKAAEAAVIAYYGAKGFEPRRVTHLPCGYDFIFAKGRTTLHVEVKGTASAVPQFFLTRNEHAIGMMSNPAWRLAMVTCALTETPKIDIYEAKALKKEFDLEPYVFLGKFIPKSGG